MKKLLPILMFALLLPPRPASAQAILDNRGDTVGIMSTGGREILTISQERSEEGIFLVNVGGFRIRIAGTVGDPGPEPAAGSEKTYRNQITIGGMQFGFIGLTSPDYSMYPEGTPEFLNLRSGKSISVSFEAMFRFALGKPVQYYSKRGPYYTYSKYFSVGLRPRWDNYTFDDRITLVRRDGMVWPEPLGEMRRYKKSKMTTFSLDIPVMFSISPAKHWEIEAGAYGGFTLAQYTKVKFRKEKDKSDLGAQFFNAGLTLRVQYRCVGVFCNYSLTPLFKSGAGPKTQPFTIGFFF